MKRRVLISGGRGGIARAIVAALGDAYEVSAPVRHELDVTDHAAIEAWVQAHPPHILVNNAGTIHPGTVRDSSPEDWELDIRVNLIGAYWLTRAALRAGCSVIINISSTAGFAGYKEWSAYCAAKAGINALTKSLAAEGVQAYAISPGATDTKFRDGLGLPSDRLQSPSVIGDLVLDILAGKFRPGDNLFVRKGEFEVR